VQDATIRVKVSDGLFPSEKTVELAGGRQYFVSINLIHGRDEMLVHLAEEGADAALVYFATMDGTKYARVPLSSVTWRRWT
jgi:hypothetical protein